MSKKIFIVVPCFNESACLPETNKILTKKMTSLIKSNLISKDSRIVYVDDGSKDNTWEIIRSFSKPSIGLKLSRNFGHQNALMAGMFYSKDKADAVITIDADLQDDIDTIEDFVKKFNEGYAIVYGVRSDRKTDSIFKRWSAQFFYKLMLYLGVELIYNSADYRLMSRQALTELSKYKETNLFLRGVIPTIGLKTSEVTYSRKKRFAGSTKYPLKKMLSFAWEGITSFSIKPIRLVFSIGVLFLILSLAIVVYTVVAYINGITVSGWAFIMCSIWLISALQMLSIGLIGEYVGKIYKEVKERPRYIISEIVE